jgi:hypothetical protein
LLLKNNSLTHKLGHRAVNFDGFLTDAELIGKIGGVSSEVLQLLKQWMFDFNCSGFKPFK